MPRRRLRSVLTFAVQAALVAGLLASLHLEAKDAVKDAAKDTTNATASLAAPGFPTGYRSWTHVKSALVGSTFPSFDTQGGLHHIYANDKAMEGLRSGSFPDGATLVFDLVEAREKNGLTAEGPRRRVDVMVKDRQGYPKSGGWWFGRYLGDDREHEALSPTERADCFRCHQQPRTRDLVFSEFRK